MNEMKIIKITKEYFETEDGRIMYHEIPLDEVPPLEEFQKMYDEAENFFGVQEIHQRGIIPQDSILYEIQRRNNYISRQTGPEYARILPLFTVSWGHNLHQRQELDRSHTISNVSNCIQTEDNVFLPLRRLCN